jgi:hypothetical protein
MPQRKFNNQRRKPNRNIRRQRAIINAPRNTSVLTGRTEKLARRQVRGIVRIPRLMFTPEAILVDLTYPDVTYTKNNVGSPFLSWRYRMNSVFDPDPALGSGSVPGYTYYSGGYGSYRVLTLGYSIDLSNLEASPLDIVAVPSNTDLGLNYAAVNELFGNPYASQALISAKGGMDRARLKGSIDIGEFWGNPGQYLNDDSFGGTVGANPGTLLFLNVGANSATNFTASNGVDFRVSLTYTVLWYKRLIVIS